MADTDKIEIKLVVKDEVSRQLDSIFQKWKQHDSAFTTGKHQNEINAVTRGLQFMRRELSSIAQITGVGGLIGGGVVASLAAVTKALGEFAREGLGLKYTAQEFGVTTATLTKYTDALTALGKSHEEAQSNITSAMGALRDLQTFGSKSGVFKQLSEAKGGRQLAIDLMNELNGPRGMDGALKMLFTRLRNVKDSEAQRFLSKAFNLGGINAKDIDENLLKNLHKRIELSEPQLKATNLAWANLKISWGNIGTTLASSLLPAIERLLTALDKWLQSEAGQEFSKQLAEWGKQLADAVDAWIAEGGLDRAANTLKDAIESLKASFNDANPVMEGVGSWAPSLKLLVGIGLAVWLLQVAGALRALGRFRWLFPYLGVLMYLAEKLGEKERDAVPGMDLEFDPFNPQKKSVWDRLRERGGGSIWEGLKNSFKWPWESDSSSPGGAPGVPGATPQSGQGKTEQEQKADQAQERYARRELTDEFKTLRYDLAKLNDYLLPGGPEGSADGSSGFQFDTTSVLGPAGGGKKNRPWPVLPAAATPLSQIWSNVRGLFGNRPAQSTGTGFASWYGNRPDLGFVDPEDRGRQGVREKDQGIALGPEATRGQYHYLTDPHTGLTHVVRQTDTGPNIRTQKLVDIHASQLARMGYTKKTFPDARGLWNVSPAGFGQPQQEAAWAGRGGGMDESDFTTPALREAMGLTGSTSQANIDIDVSALAKGTRSDNLFRPTQVDTPQQDQPSGNEYSAPNRFRYE